MPLTFILKIFRGTPGNQYFEEFELTKAPGLNIISCLMEIQKKPVTKDGKKVAPVVWEQGCLEEVCGSCSMLINGFPRQACTALVDKILQSSTSNEITLAPFSKFPLVRDLIVDRSIMFDNLKKAHAWIDTDGSYDLGPGPLISPEKQQIMYSISKCMTCGCCVEACPQSYLRSKFVGPHIFAQVRLYNDHPTGHMQQAKRLNEMMKEGGITGCGKAQNCQKVCPRDVPLVESISALGRDVTIQAIKNIFSLPDRES